MADRLLDEFPPVTKQEWLDKVVSDLKGKPYEKLVRISESGIPIAPVYTAQDLPAGVDKSFPGQDDLRRGDSRLMEVSHGGWLICQDLGQVHLDDFEGFTQQFEKEAWTGRIGLRIVLANGLRYALTPNSLEPTAGGLVVDNWGDLERIVAWAEEKEAILYFELGDASVDFLDSGFLGRVVGGIDLNPLNFYRNGKADESLLAVLMLRVVDVMKKLPSEADRPYGFFFKLFTLNLQDLELAGANAAQQIAFALAMATDLVDRFSKLGVAPDEVFRLIAVQFPISTDFFGEVAKIRAFRIVWGQMLGAWGLPGHPADYTYVIGVPSIVNETVADPHVNLLRHTTEAMAAAIGGCITVTLPAYNGLYEVPTADAIRIARNIQLVLKNESYLSNVIDPAGGAYFVESLTDQLAAKAWAIFQEIEAAGGWYSYLQQDLLLPSLAEGKRKRMTAVSSGAKTILGTNHFPNEKEKVNAAHFPTSGALHESAIFQRTKTFGAALGIVHPGFEGSRLALPFEDLRLKMQELKVDRPNAAQALLLTMGDPMMRAARAHFARNVLAAGGFVCTENVHPVDLENAVSAAKQLDPSVIVLCGADADYLEQGAKWLSALQLALPDAVVLLAGKPEGWEKLKESGIVEPLFAGMDRVSFLGRLLESLKAGKGVRL